MPITDLQDIECYSYADEEITMRHALLIDCELLPHISSIQTQWMRDRIALLLCLMSFPPTHSAENPITTKYRAIQD